MTGLQSLDRTQEHIGSLVNPSDRGHLAPLLRRTPHWIPRGSGLSYVQASAGEEAISVSSQPCRRILEFDDVRGRVRVESGVSVGDLLRYVAQRGWYFPVLPGYPAITIGGCVAFNTHGKSQHNQGCFGDWVHEITLIRPDGIEQVCSRSTGAELFELTIGGLGLTGFIVEVELRLTRLESPQVLRLTLPADNLHHAVSLMREHGTEQNLVYAWNDLNLRGEAFGRGLVYVESFSKEASGPAPCECDYSTATDGALLRRHFPIAIHTRWTTPIMLQSWYWLQRAIARPTTRSVLEMAFPIFGKEWYYSMFGLAGFREYQTIVPDGEWEGFVEALRYVLRRARVPVTLGSLKLFRGRRRALDFCGDGVCLALDVPASPESLPLFESVDAIVLAHGGLANLSKDSRLPREVVREMYPGYDEFRSALRALDPERRIRSALRERLGV